MHPPTSDPNLIRAALALLAEPGQVIELRALGTHRGTVSGYFDDPEKLTEAAVYWSGKCSGVYVTPNPVRRDLLARACNRTVEYARVTTKDDEIIARRWLLYDFDAVRPAGISASDEEHLAALHRAKACRDWLIAECGWPKGILADSGNGGHLLFRVDLPNDEQSKERFRGALSAGAGTHACAQVTVDPTTFNAARIWKLYGTLAAKGDPLPDRPHRLAQLLAVPPEVVPITGEQIDALAARVPKPAPKISLPAAPRLSPDESRRRVGQGEYATLDAPAWFTAHGHYGRALGPGKHAVLCPWAAEHSDSRPATDSDTVIWEAQGDVWPVFHCSHAHCAGRELADVMELWGDADTYCREAFAGGVSWPTVPKGPSNGAFPCFHVINETSIPRDQAELVVLSLARIYRRKGLDEEGALASVRTWNVARCDPPLHASRIRSALRSAFSGEARIGCGNLQAAGLCPAKLGTATCPIYGRADADAEPVREQLEQTTEFSIEPLRKIDTDPPTYEATVGGQIIRVSLSALMEWRAFKKACVAVLNLVPVLPRARGADGGAIKPQTVWEQHVLNPALRAMDAAGNIEPAPPEASAAGATWENVLWFLREVKPVSTKEAAYSDKVALLDGHFVFRGRFLRRWCSEKRAELPSPADLWAVIKDHGGLNGTIRTKNGVCNVWRIPVESTGLLEGAADE